MGGRMSKRSDLIDCNIRSIIVKESWNIWLESQLLKKNDAEIKVGRGFLKKPANKCDGVNWCELI